MKISPYLCKRKGEKFTEVEKISLSESAFSVSVLKPAS